MKSFYYLSTIFVLSLIFTLNSFAMINLKDIQISKENEAEFVFDGEISQNQISTDFFKDTIQFNLSDVNIYPSKIIPVSDSFISKLFAYQYTPKIVRCRFTIKGKAEDFRSKFVAQASGNSLKVKFNLPNENSSKVDDEATEEEIIKKILKSEEQTTIQDSHGISRENTHSSSAPASENLTNPSIENEKPKTTDINQNTSNIFSKVDKPNKKGSLSLWTPFIKLLILLSVFFLSGVLLKKLKSNNLSSSASWMKNLQKAIGSGLSKDPKMIQVMANHYLDPKKRITVVRIGTRMLVLGVTQESINLITEMSPEENDDFVGHVFDDFLKKEQIRQPLSDPQSSFKALQMTNVRSQIRNRLEGLKPL